VSEPSAVSDAELLREGCDELGVSLSASQHDALLRYLDLLYVWNRSAGLTTIAQPDAVRLHLLDSLAAVDAVTNGPCLDLGTGGGLPGIVLAVVRPALSFVLVESNRRKCSFLLEVVRSVSLPNVCVVESDYDRFVPDQLFPTVISRAFRPPAEFLAISRRFVAPQGQVVLLLADPPDSELAALAHETGFRVESCRRLRLPRGGEPRTVVRFQELERPR
jgi:16S rRNA (guanine527-N7)-methyltransferase